MRTVSWYSLRWMDLTDPSSLLLPRSVAFAMSLCSDLPHPFDSGLSCVFRIVDSMQAETWTGFQHLTFFCFCKIVHEWGTIQFMVSPHPPDLICRSGLPCAVLPYSSAMIPDSPNLLSGSQGPGQDPTFPLGPSLCTLAHVGLSHSAQCLLAITSQIPHLASG